MSQTIDEFGSNQQRSLNLRQRADLSIVPQVYRGEKFFLIKDPLELQFYRLNTEEYFVLELIDGKRSLEQIKQEFERRFAPQKITCRDLQAFIVDLHKKSLLAYVDGNVTLQILERKKEKNVEKLKRRLGSIFSIKWRGVDPDRFLSWLTPKIGWIFSWPALVVSLFLVVVAFLWICVQYDHFTSRLPELTQFFAQSNWLLLVVAIFFMKIVHELAHGIAFKRYGGECHEIGVMIFMLIIPTLYCNTSDSWMLRNKWKRAAIGAAGMYIEMLMAAIATFVWWNTEPGSLNMFCLNVMVSGSISVVLINGNPFIRFDGYYIASDLLEVPNLGERSGKQTQCWFLKYCLGIDEPAEVNSRLSTKMTLVVYAVLSFLFKSLLMFIITLVLIRQLEPYGLNYVGLFIGITAAMGLLLPIVIAQFRFFKIPGRFRRIEMKKMTVFCCVLIALGVLVFAIPFPHEVTCSFELQHSNAKFVFVKHDAVLKEIHVVQGQFVKKGQPIVTLENPKVEIEKEELESNLNECLAELDLLEQTRTPSPAIASRIEELKELVATKTNSIKKTIEILDSFEVVAPQDGIVCSVWVNRQIQDELHLATLEGNPLSNHNLGAWINRGVKLCLVGNPESFDAVLAVNEHLVSMLREGQEARLMVDGQPWQRYQGSVNGIAKRNAEQLPMSLTADYGGSIKTRNVSLGEQSSRQPEDEHFEVRVRLPTSSSAFSHGMRGEAKISVAPKSIFQKIKLIFFRSFRKKI